MLLDDLVAEIERLKMCIETHRATLQENEIRTRVALIDPLLALLGWSPADPALVTPEYPFGRDRADYALLGAGGAPVAVIEAKRLGEPLAAHRIQMVNYANVSGIPHAGLTDGEHWELYKVFDPSPIENRKVLDINLLRDQSTKVALSLLILWNSNLKFSEPKEASRPIFDKENPVDQEKILPEGQKYNNVKIIDNLSANRGNTWIPLSQVKVKKGIKPTFVRILDAEEREVRFWNDVLVYVVEWLWKQNLLTLDDLPIRSSSQRYIIDQKPYHPTQQRFRQEKLIEGTSLYVETHKSAREIVRTAANLLEKYDQRQDIMNICF